MHFAPIGIVYSDDPKVHKGLNMLPFPSFSVFINKSYPLSRGQIRLASADPTAAPILEPQLLSDERDGQTLAPAIELVPRIASTGPMAEMIAEEVEPGNHCTTREALADYVRRR